MNRAELQGALDRAGLTPFDLARLCASNITTVDGWFQWGNFEAPEYVRTILELAAGKPLREVLEGCVDGEAYYRTYSHEYKPPVSGFSYCDRDLPADELRAALRRIKMTQKEFAKECGVSLPAVNYWLKKSRVPARAVKILIELQRGLPREPRGRPSSTRVRYSDLLADELHDALHRMKMTRKEFAGACGVHLQTVNYWIKQGRVPLKAAERLAELQALRAPKDDGWASLT